ncbi:MAG TPA: MCE family protein [Epsilonproteobacteria bacterium]|nr:MCE family protein [Campylobacterota bacterium]
MSEELPEIQESNRLNFLTSIWIVPLVAIVIALWLAFQYVTELGPKIEITFQNNEGLKAGQSQVKFRDVPIGKVEKVMLGEDGKGVKVIARINKETVDYLNEEAKFWIVKPEVGIGGISGLDTILTGTYINMISEKKTMNKKKFIGLEQPYRLLEEGDYFHLNASSSYNLKKGTPVFFKSMKAGYIEYITIALDGQSVDVIVYIDKTYIPYIHTDSKFWVQSSVAIDYLNGQLNLNVAPLSNIVRGGIEFSSSGDDAGKKVPYDYIFRLYKDSAVAAEKKIGKGGKAIKKYHMIFNESTAKLKKDASVKYDQYDVGRVEDITYSYDQKSHQLSGDALVSIDTSIFYDKNDTNHTGEENLEKAVTEGLSASIQEHDPISGYLYINLDFVESNRSKRIVYQGRQAFFPTVSTQGGGIMRGLNGLIDSIRKLPLESLIRSISSTSDNLSGLLKDNRQSMQQLLSDLSKTLDGINSMVGTKEFARIPTELNKTMRELQKTLRSLDSVMKSNGDQSLHSSQLAETLKEVIKASVDTQKLFRKLDQKPNSLIFGD